MGATLPTPVALVNKPKLHQTATSSLRRRRCSGECSGANHQGGGLPASPDGYGFSDVAATAASFRPTQPQDEGSPPMTNNPTTASHRDWIGSDLFDSTGDKIGSIDKVYLDDRTGQPEWLTVSTGWFGTKTQFVPIAGTTRQQDGLAVPYTKDHIKDAPSIDADGHLDEADERRLYQHYGMNYDATDHEGMYGGRERADDGYYFDDNRSTDAEVTLSEEQLAVDKRQRESGKVRL